MNPSGTASRSIHPALSPLLEQNSEKIMTCVHCGLCLPACPTYRVAGNENDSPRGRIYLMRKVVEGELGLSDAFLNHIDLCLGCRACESVCPSGVPYGHLLEAARTEVAKERGRRGSIAEATLRFVLKQIFTRPAFLRVTFATARFLRDRGIARIAFESGLVSGRLKFSAALLVASGPPPLAQVLAHASNGATGESPRPSSQAAAQASAGKAMKVAVLKGCVMEGLFARVNRATERILIENGCEIVEANNQVCCGALHAHAGYQDTARQLAKQNILEFFNSGCERVIVNAAGCGAAMKEYSHWLADEPEWSDRARAFSAKVLDISEALAETGIRKPRGQVRCTVAYDAPCHLLHGQHVAAAPVAMLESVPGISLVALPGSDACCGGAGIYNVQHPELSMDILAQKVKAIESSGVQVVATGNPGCIMQIGAGLLYQESNTVVAHPAELLDYACASPDELLSVKK